MPLLCGLICVSICIYLLRCRLPAFLPGPAVPPQIGLAARRREDAGVVALLRGDMPAVTRQLSRQLKQSSVKTKVRCFLSWFCLFVPFGWQEEDNLCGDGCAGCAHVRIM